MLRTAACKRYSVSHAVTFYLQQPEHDKDRVQTDPGQNWKYRFFVDFEGNLEDPAVKNALRGLEAEAIGVRVLGNYGQQEEI